MIRVFVVEDSALARRVIRGALESSPFIEVASVAASVDEALRHIHDIKPDVVTVDLTLQHSSGLPLLAALKVMNMPAVVVSSEQNPAIIQQVYHAGATHFVPKPENPAEIAAFKLQLVAAVKQAAWKE